MPRAFRGGQNEQLRLSHPTLIITVHGTWAAGKTPDNPKWWEKNSEFSRWLREELSGVECVFEEFMWSGANSDRDRTSAARRLASFLRQLDRSRFAKVHIIAHSHGGNVVELAMSELNHAPLMALLKPRVSEALVDTVITVGTPYFQTRVTRLTRLGQVGSVMTIPGAILIAYAFIDYFANPPFGPGVPSEEVYYLSLASLVVTSILCFFTAFPYTREFLQTMRFGRNYKRLAPRWLAISHRSDEAIAALKTADAETLELFEARGIRTSVVQSVRSLGILAFAGSIIIGIALFTSQLITASFNKDAVAVFLIPSVIIGTALPIMLTFVFLLVLVIAPTLALLGNSLLNGKVRGFSLGQDYLNYLEKVSDVPHSIEATKCILDGDWHDEMLASAQDALKSIIGKNHTDLFRRDMGTRFKDIFNRVDGGGAFDGLIHTSYFSQRRLAELIANEFR